MFYVRPVWEMVVHLVVACDVFDGALLCAVLFFHEMPWMRSGTELSQFLRIFLPTFALREGFLSADSS